MEPGDRNNVSAAGEFKPPEDARLDARRLAAARLNQETASREELRTWRGELESMIAFIDRTLVESESAEAAESASRAEAVDEAR